MIIADRLRLPLCEGVVSMAQMNFAERRMWVLFHNWMNEK